MIFFRAVMLLLLAAGAGCASTVVEEKGTAGGPIARGESVVVLGDEIGFPECVRRAMKRSDPELQFIPSLRFRDALFPWFEPGTRPNNVKELEMLLGRPVVRTRIAGLGLRFVVVISGETSESKGKGAMMCGGGPPGGVGCLGFVWWDRTTSLQADVWDLKQLNEAAKVDISVSGTALLPAFVIPVPFIPLTETEGCNVLGSKIAEKITGRSQKNAPDQHQE